jgi:transcription antitermination factor NusG
VFLPTVALARRWADRTRTVAFPLFPGYVFARFALTQLHTVISVPGLATVVRFGRRPVPVRAQDIENIRRVAAAFSVIGRKPDPQPFMKGDEVRVVGGPFEGVVGMVVEVRGNRRLLAGIRTIGLSVSIDVDISVLEPTSSYPGCTGQQRSGLTLKSGNRADPRNQPEKPAPETLSIETRQTR